MAMGWRINEILLYLVLEGNRRNAILTNLLYRVQTDPFTRTAKMIVLEINTILLAHLLTYLLIREILIFYIIYFYLRWAF